jgi:hypothetical protein
MLPIQPLTRHSFSLSLPCIFKPAHRAFSTGATPPPTGPGTAAAAAVAAAATTPAPGSSIFNSELMKKFMKKYGKVFVIVHLTVYFSFLTCECPPYIHHDSIYYYIA